MGSERIIAIPDLLELLGIPVSTIYAWRYRGEGPTGYRVGKHVRFRRSDVDARLATLADPVGGR